MKTISNIILYRDLPPRWLLVGKDKRSGELYVYPHSYRTRKQARRWRKRVSTPEGSYYVRVVRFYPSYID